jgi:PAS domain S-box-containing protein
MGSGSQTSRPTTPGAGRRAKDALEAKERYRALVHASPDAVTVTDLEGRIVEVSQRAVDWYGFGSAEELIGLSAFELIAPETRAQAALNLGETLRTGWGRLVGEALRKDGSRFLAELTASLIRDAGGAPVAFIGVTRDISQARSAEQALVARNEELARANEELARLQRAKDELVATISHELRTPLVTGIGYLDMLLEGRFGKLTPAGQRRMQVAQKNLKRLSRLIDDLLQYNRVVQSARRYAPALQRVDLLEVIDECVTELLARTRRRRRSLTVEVDEQVPPVSADPDLLRTVISNLLDNAARHAGRSQIRVSARARQEHVEIVIADDGRGMDAASQLRAFDPFYQAGEDREGLGLGLFIVRAIVESHGSSVRLESAPGEGTTISFSLAAVR